MAVPQRAHLCLVRWLPRQVVEALEQAARASATAASATLSPLAPDELRVARSQLDTLLQRAPHILSKDGCKVSLLHGRHQASGSLLAPFLLQDTEREAMPVSDEGTIAPDRTTMSDRRCTAGRRRTTQLCSACGSRTDAAVAPSRSCVQLLAP